MWTTISHTYLVWHSVWGCACPQVYAFSCFPTLLRLCAFSQDHILINILMNCKRCACMEFDPNNTSTRALALAYELGSNVGNSGPAFWSPWVPSVSADAYWLKMHMSAILSARQLFTPDALCVHVNMARPCLGTSPRTCLQLSSDAHLIFSSPRFHVSLFPHLLTGGLHVIPLVEAHAAPPLNFLCANCWLARSRVVRTLCSSSWTDAESLWRTVASSPQVRLHWVLSRS